LGPTAARSGALSPVSRRSRPVHGLQQTAFCAVHGPWQNNAILLAHIVDQLARARFDLSEKVCNRWVRGHIQVICFRRSSVFSSGALFVTGSQFAPQRLTMLFVSVTRILSICAPLYATIRLCISILDALLRSGPNDGQYFRTHSISVSRRLPHSCVKSRSFVH
jgi:hypothetical protein